MSRRNSRFQKAIRREQRDAAKERAQFIQDASNQLPIAEGQSLRFISRKERRGRR
jgi:hypothetical protein